MEVHHPHHATHKKKWSAYLSEFFMLFLAVFLGFIAENTRENLAERNQEKEYVRSLIDDIKADTSNAQAVIIDFQKRLPPLNAIINHYGDLMKGQSNVVIPNLQAIYGYKDFYFTDGTIQQLKNAGGLQIVFCVMMALQKCCPFSKTILATMCTLRYGTLAVYCSTLIKSIAC